MELLRINAEIAKEALRSREGSRGCESTVRIHVAEGQHAQPSGRLRLDQPRWQIVRLKRDAKAPTEAWTDRRRKREERSDRAERVRALGGGARVSVRESARARSCSAGMKASVASCTWLSPRSRCVSFVKYARSCAALHS
eukprot:6205937-Pleurochrysis_carterae.AAC.3